MFTIKATDQTGHSVYACHRYRFQQASSIDGFQTLDLLDDSGNRIEIVSIIGPTYVMNAAGKTVDKFDREYPPEPFVLPGADQPHRADNDNRR